MPNRGDGNKSDDDGQKAEELQSVLTSGMGGANNWIQEAGSCGIGWYAEAFTAGRRHGEAWGAALGVDEEEGSRE